MYGLGASVHCEQLPLALETAKHVIAGTVWINCHNMFDAAAGFGGIHFWVLLCRKNKLVEIWI